MDVLHLEHRWFNKLYTFASLHIALIEFAGNYRIQETEETDESHLNGKIIQTYRENILVIAYTIEHKSLIG